MIYGPSGIGKESISRELAKKNNWSLFPQHLAFDVACAVIGFGKDGFEQYQRNIVLQAIQTLLDRKVEGIVLSFCYVSPFSNYFMEGLLDLLKEHDVSSTFVYLECGFDEHVRRVTSEGRKNTNKIQSKKYLESYLAKYDFSENIPGVESATLDTTKLTQLESAIEIEKIICAKLAINSVGS
jgi:shikimate kinase